MGKFLVALIVLTSIAFGAGIYYTQVYAYYDTVTPNGVNDVELTRPTTGQREAIDVSDFQAIDSQSSPIRYRACFTTNLDLATAAETYEPFDAATPLTGPKWFDCYDAGTVTEALENGSATAFMGQENIQFGVDRIVAITQDGHGYVWHQLNKCGEKAYDGSSVRDDCPEMPQGN